jgi:hypothetical protein
MGMQVVASVSGQGLSLRKSESLPAWKDVRAVRVLGSFKE